jgi:MoaA/NifB/PqqE/SkfB family radical SAM enzyme
MANLLNRLRDIKEYLSYFLSYSLNYPFTYPKDLNFQMTNKCPLRCKMCNIPKLKINKKELSVEEMKKVLNEVKGWKTTKYVSFVGGEALVRKNDAIELIDYANKLGFHTTIVTNGYFLDKKTCERLINAGLKRISFSVDGACKETHDFIRGKGSFKKVIRGIKNMKKISDERIKMDFNTVIMSYNFEELPEIYYLARDLEMDQIFFQTVVIDNTYKLDSSAYEKVDYWIKGEQIKKLNEIIKKLIALKLKDKFFIFNSISYFRKVPLYFKLKEKFNPGPCLAGYIGLNIDPYGEISICGLGPNLNVKNNSVSELWKDKRFKATRIAIKHCKIPCMMLCYQKFDWIELLRYLINGWS